MKRWHINNPTQVNVTQQCTLQILFMLQYLLSFFPSFFSFSSVDPEYKKFLESYSADDEKLTSTPETLLEEIEARNKELIGMEICVL